MCNINIKLKYSLSSIFSYKKYFKQTKLSIVMATEVSTLWGQFFENFWSRGCLVVMFVASLGQFKQAICGQACIWLELLQWPRYGFLKIITKFKIFLKNSIFILIVFPCLAAYSSCSTMSGRVLTGLPPLNGEITSKNHLWPLTRTYLGWFGQVCLQLSKQIASSYNSVLAQSQVFRTS